MGYVHSNDRNVIEQIVIARSDVTVIVKTLHEVKSTFVHFNQSSLILSTEVNVKSTQMNLLWRKESKNRRLYENIFQNIPENHDAYSEAFEKMSALELNGKNDKTSSDVRTLGNKKFKEKEWLEAMSLYNQSLCYAENGSENVSLAYANRSACFLHLKLYENCLVDIGLAKQANYPMNLMSKLEKRNEDCLKLMAASDGRRYKLSYEADENLPGMANVLEIRCDKNFGRHIVAKCDIPVGKIILAEKAFIARYINTDYNNCAVCMNMSTNFIPCSQCPDALFCNNGCADNDVHKIDCGRSFPLYDDPTLKYYMGAIFFMISKFTDVENLIVFVEEAIKEERIKPPNSLNDVKSKFKALLQLSKNDNPTAETFRAALKDAYVIYTSLQKRKSIQNMFDTEGKKRFLMHLVLHLRCVAQNNGFTVEGIKMSLYIIASYFNHACASNVSGLNTDENVRYCRTNRPIKAGQQLFITYLGDLFCEPSVAYCQTHLYENFGFQCKCERCKPNEVSWSMNSHRMQLDADFQMFNLRYYDFMNDGVGTEEEKEIILEKKAFDVLNRHGDKHWCDELAAAVEKYDSYFR